MTSTKPMAPASSTAALPVVLRDVAERAKRLGLSLHLAENAPLGTNGVRVASESDGLWSLDLRHGEHTLRGHLADQRCPQPPAGALRVADADAESHRLAESLRWSLEDAVAKHANEAVLADFCEKLAQSYEETYTLFRALRLLASREEPLVVIERLCGDIQRTLPFRWLAVQFANHARVVPDLRGRFVLAGAAPTARDQLATLAASRLARTPRDSWTKVLAPGKDDLATAAGTELVSEPVTHDGIVVGMLFAGGKSGPDREIASPEIQFLDATADFLGTFHENMARFHEQRAMTHATLESLAPGHRSGQ